MRYILLFSILLVFKTIYAQIVVTDINNKPIPYVEVLSNNKHFYTQTNSKGELDWNEVKKLNSTDTLFFQLITYEKAYFLKSELTSTDTIRLEEQIQDGIQELQEFVVLSNNKKYKYQVIDGCYRSYQINDDSVAYYMDGNAQWASKIDKGRFYLKLKENRAFANLEVEEVVENPERNIDFRFTTNVPRPPFYYLPFQYDKDITYRKKDSFNVEMFIKDSIYVGNIETNNRYVIYTIADYDFVGTNTLFKNEISRLYNHITLVFRNYVGFDVTSIENYDELLYYKSHRAYTVKHEKDKEYKRTVQVDELFVEQVSYFQTINKKEFNSSIGMPKQSNYTLEFWNSCNCEVYEKPIRHLLSNLYER